MDREKGCSHLDEIDIPAAPRADACEECGSTHSLRVCMTCGHVGCCDSQHGHARDHAVDSGHQLISAWKGGAFVYCYEHRYL